MLFESLAPPLNPLPDDITLPQFILDNAFNHPNQGQRSADMPCLIDEDSGKAVMLAELRSRTDALARSFSAIWSLGSESTVAIIAPNHVDYPVCVWATHRLGGIVASMSPGLTKNELIPQIRLSKPALIVAHTDSLEVILDTLRALNMDLSHVAVLDGEKSPDRLPYKSIEGLVAEGASHPAFVERKFRAGEAIKSTAFLCFSSGTTGQPKAVAISHYNVMCNVIQTATFNRVNEEYGSSKDRRFSPGDICTGVLPFYHIYGLVTNLHYLLYSAMTIVVTKKFVFEKFLQSISRYRITHLQIVPPMAVLLSKYPTIKSHDLSSVKYCMIAAAPVSAELTAQLLDVLPNIHLGQGYGMTETCAAVSMFPISQKVGTLGSGGQLVSGTTAKVVKTDGTLATYDEPGELWVKGGQVTLGYLGNDDATKESFIDGWYRTGDEVIFRKNGDIFITDRIKELIKSKGYQVAPAELEGHLLSHPDIADAGVVGVKDEYAGEVPLAFVVLSPTVAATLDSDTDGVRAQAIRDSIFKHVSDNKSRYKWLTGGIVFIEAIPKSASGKILRRVLRESAKDVTVRSHPSAKL